MYYRTKTNFEYTQLHPGVLKHSRPRFTMELVDRLSLIPWVLDADYLEAYLFARRDDKANALYMNGIPMEGGRLTLETKHHEFGSHNRFQLNVVFTDESGTVSRWRYRDFIGYKTHTRDKSLLGRLRLTHEGWCKKLFGFIEDLFIAITDSEFNKTIKAIKAYGPDMEGMVAYAINTLSWHISLLVTPQWASTPPLFLTHLIPILPKRFELIHEGGVKGTDYTLKIGKEVITQLTIDSKRSSGSALIQYNNIPRIRVKPESYIPNLD